LNPQYVAKVALPIKPTMDMMPVSFLREILNLSKAAVLNASSIEILEEIPAINKQKKNKNPKTP